MVLKRCDKCGYEWEYKGQHKFYITCPRCLKKMKVKEEQDAQRDLPTESN